MNINKHLCCKTVEKINRTMSQEELHSYRLSSMEEPTDEMLHAIMEQVAESARRSSEKADAYIKEQFERIRQMR